LRVRVPIFEHARDERRGIAAATATSAPRNWGGPWGRVGWEWLSGGLHLQTTLPEFSIEKPQIAGTFRTGKARIEPLDQFLCPRHGRRVLDDPDVERAGYRRNVRMIGAGPAKDAGPRRPRDTTTPVHGRMQHRTCTV
jgi:hypothetical protein